MFSTYAPVLQGYMSYAGSSLNAARGLLPDVTSAAVPPGERAGSVDVRPREEVPRDRQQHSQHPAHREAGPIPLPAPAVSGMLLLGQHLFNFF